MNVLIVTYYGENSNYGAYYQALALSEYVKLSGHNAYFYGRKELDETGDGSDYGKKIQIHLEQSRSINFQISYDEDREFDLAILGSDQIWCDKKPYFYGRNLKARRIISYAPSIGNLISSNVKWKNIIKNIVGPLSFFQWRNDIKKLAGVSVRDEQTYRLVKNTTGISAEIVLDPTFLVDWKKFCAKNPIEGNYIVIYSYGLNAEMYDTIQEIASKNNYKVVALNHECKWADYNADYSPEEVLAIFRDSKLVFTDTFHGTVFSLIFNREVIVLKNSPITKPYMLLKQFGISNRCAVDSVSIKECVMEKIDYNTVSVLISDARMRSKAFLNRFLEGEL